MRGGAFACDECAPQHSLDDAYSYRPRESEASTDQLWTSDYQGGYRPVRADHVHLYSVAAKLQHHFVQRSYRGYVPEVVLLQVANELSTEGSDGYHNHHRAQRCHGNACQAVAHEQHPGAIRPRLGWRGASCLLILR